MKLVDINNVVGKWLQNPETYASYIEAYKDTARELKENPALYKIYIDGLKKYGLYNQVFTNTEQENAAVENMESFDNRWDEKFGKVYNDNDIEIVETKDFLKMLDDMEVFE